MESFPSKEEFIALLVKILPPLLVASMAKIASDYVRGRRVPLLSYIAIFILSVCGGVLGYYISCVIGYTQYKMALCIAFFTLFSENMFKFIFSKTFINNMLGVVEDGIKSFLQSQLNRLNKKP